MNNKMNVSEIENYLYGMFKSVSPDRTFVGSLPETIKSNWNDMVLISCDNGVRDYDAYGNGVMLIFAYARPMSSGTKNVAKLKAMEEAINAIIENQDSSGAYYVYRVKSYTDYDFSRNWHCNVVSLGITVK